MIEGTDLYVCTEEEFNVATLPIALLDVRYADTIGEIADMIYSLNRR